MSVNWVLRDLRQKACVYGRLANINNEIISVIRCINIYNIFNMFGVFIFDICIFNNITCIFDL